MFRIGQKTLHHLLVSHVKVCKFVCYRDRLVSLKIVTKLTGVSLNQFSYFNAGSCDLLNLG